MADLWCSLFRDCRRIIGLLLTPEERWAVALTCRFAASDDIGPRRHPPRFVPHYLQRGDMGTWSQGAIALLVDPVEWMGLTLTQSHDQGMARILITHTPGNGKWRLVFDETPFVAGQVRLCHKSGFFILSGPREPDVDDVDETHETVRQLRYRANYLRNVPPPVPPSPCLEFCIWLMKHDDAFPYKAAVGILGARGDIISPEGFLHMLEVRKIIVISDGLLRFATPHPLTVKSSLLERTTTPSIIPHGLARPAS